MNHKSRSLLRTMVKKVRYFLKSLRELARKKGYRTDGEHSPTAIRHDCSCDQDSSLSPNNSPSFLIIDPTQESPPDAENQKSYPHDSPLSVFGSDQGISGPPNLPQHQIRGVQMVELGDILLKPAHLTHIGLIDASPFPNPHNEKTKIALVDGWMRRVPLSHPAPEFPSPLDQTADGQVDRTSCDIGPSSLQGNAKVNGLSVEPNCWPPSNYKR